MKNFLLTLALLVPFTLFAQSTGSYPVEETVREIMTRQIIGVRTSINKELEKEKDEVDRDNLLQNPSSPFVSRYSENSSNTRLSADQITATATITKNMNFKGDNLGTSGSYPPDNMGAVGPAQYIVAENSRVVTFNKYTGLADGVLNTTIDNFWASVVTSGGFTCDPHIRYDRLSKRWINIAIDVPATSIANRVLIAVSSDSIITASTTWKYFYYQHSGSFYDYPTLGIDKNAIYIGGNLFNLSNDSFTGTIGLVIKKSSILGNGPIAYTKFSLGTSSAGVYTPQGVDNLYDTTATEGYFIGTDMNLYGVLGIVRVSNPAGTPSIATVTLTVPTTNTADTLFARPGTANYRLDPDDDRLFAAMIRNGHLWTAHHVKTNNLGVVSATATQNTRVSARWYDITNFNTGSTVTLNQSGTVNSSNQSGFRDKSISYPTISVNGQGHALMGFTISGYYSYANAGFTYRLNNYTPGFMAAPDSNTASTTSYNPSSTIDPAPHRWGDYTMTEVDPSDDMTFWTIQEYCDASNSWACQVTSFKAPGPAALTSVSPATIGKGSNLTIVIKGDTTTGLGFYEPGASFQKHLAVAIDGGVVVNKVTYNSPSTITLDISTDAATDGARTITVTNPDGQVVSSSLLTYNSSLPVELTSFTAEVVKQGQVKLNWSTATEINNNYFEVQRSFGSKDNWVNVATIKGNGTKVTSTNYSFVDNNNFQHGKYYYRLKQVDNDGTTKFIPEIEVNYAAPASYSLSQNYPNPFNPSTRIQYSVPEKINVKLAVYDILGKEVSILVNEIKEAGSYDVNFDASSIAAGTYFYKLQAGEFMTVKKMSLIK